MKKPDNLMSNLKFFRNNWGKLLTVFLTCSTFLILVVIFSGDYLILGGEGNYFTDPRLLLDYLGLFPSWSPVINGIGFPNPVVNCFSVFFNFLSLLQKLGMSFKTVNILSVFLVYVLPFLSMLWMLCRILKIDFKISYILSLFYILNPYSMLHLQGLMFWNAAPLFVLPLVFGCIYKYYFIKFRLFLFLGILTSILSYALCNVPYLGIFHIFLFISVVIISYMRGLGFNFKAILGNLLVIELSFIFFNVWWLINFLRFVFQDVSNFYSTEFAVGWVKAYVIIGDVLGRFFSLRTLVSFEKNYYFSDFYYSIPLTIVLFIPFFLIICHFLIKTKKQENSGDQQNMFTVTILFVLLVIFLNKGASEPFGDVYIWMLNSIPFFSIFKSPIEKFSVLLLFLLTLALVSVFRDTKKKWPYNLFFIYLIVCSIPYLTLSFMPEYKFETSGEGKFISRKYLDKEDYFNAREFLNKNKLDYRNVSLPGSANYQVTILNHDGNRYYRGMDPFNSAVNKSFITAYSEPIPHFFDSIFNNFSNSSIEGTFNIYNVKKIIFNKDIYPSFGNFREKMSFKELSAVFSKIGERQDYNSIVIFNRRDFLPHFYTAEQLAMPLISTIDKLPKIMVTANYQGRPAIYFQNQNENYSTAYKRMSVLANKNSGHISSTTTQLPILEFKRINSSKYRIIMHRALGEIPLIFSESFHDGWKIYLAGMPKPILTTANLGDYKILDGNKEDQASNEELVDYISKGWVTNLGDGKDKVIEHKKWEDNKEKLDYVENYKIDFISKNFKGTIQNDNLSTGSFYETWNKKTLGEKDGHLIANGYANSWLLNINLICSKGNFCRRNVDGTYDLEVVVEFAPQRLFYVGFFILGATILTCLGYVVYDWRKKIRNHKI